MKQKIFTIALAFLSTSNAFAIDLNDVVRDEHGKVVNMTAWPAREYCAKQDRRLPTIRELADFSASNGSVIRDSAHKGSDTETAPTALQFSILDEINEMRKFRFYPVSAQRSEHNSKVPDFFMNTDGYKAPTNEFLYVMSSDFDVWNGKPRPTDDPYMLAVSRGSLGLVNPSGAAGAVICVK